MSKFLIAAEVDKIQSFIFRSSRLREVAGASRLLEDFCEEVKQKYGSRALSSAGGSFRIVVDESEIDMVISDLRQKFEQNIGGTITITSVPYSSDSDVIKRGNAELRRAKLTGDDPDPIWHSPYHAICASSGEELAVAYGRPGGFLENGQPRFPDERPRYMGRTTLQKGDENAVVSLLDGFIERMQQTTRYNNLGKLDNPTEADTYARFDPRQYVAYMVSDGNSMGAMFNACTTSQLPELSQRIGEITSDALIHAVEGMCAETHRNGQMRFPVLPLISGGDDLFVLMPAPWAIDVAIEFSKAYQEGMSAQLRSMGLLNEHANATTGVAVVICKATYPYRTAYQYAHELLGKAKRRAKEVNRSCLIVDFVVGSDTVAVSNRMEPQSHTFEEAGYFVDHRFALRGLPSRVLHQIEAALIQQQDTAAVVERVRQLYPHLEYADALQAALSDSSRLRELLKLWDFCYDMDRQRDEYLREER